jgi:DNA-binding CsgD family transcriptional regulator
VAGTAAEDHRRLRAGIAASSPGSLRPEIEFEALVELVSASSNEVADRAHAALAPALAHDALVLVTPGSAGLPVQMAAPPELLKRLASFDWSTVVEHEPPEDGCAARVALPDLIGGMRVAGWAARVGSFTVTLIVGAEGSLPVAPAPEQAAVQVAMVVAARAQGADRDPSPGTLAFSHAISQERQRVRSELRSRHAVTLSSMLHTLRRSTGPSGSRAAPPAVLETIELASQGLLELKAAAKRQDTSRYVEVRAAFAEAEAEIRGIVRAGHLELIADLHAEEEAPVPRAIAQAARIVTRAGALNAASHPGAGKLRVHWQLTPESLAVTIADNGAGFGDAEDRPGRELAYMRRRVASLRGTVVLDTAPHWGSALSCELPLHGPPLAPESPTAERIAHLRARECEVLELMVAGMSNHDIADRLCISLRTVKFHVSNILRKLDVHSRTEAIALAHASGISAPAES